MPEFQAGDKVSISFMFGDRKADGKLDVTVEAYSVIPLITDKPVKILSFTVDSHIEELPKLAAAALSMVAPMLGGGLAAVVGGIPKLSNITSIFKLPGA